MIRGIEVAGAWFDEMMPMDPTTFAVQQAVLGVDRALGRKVVDPIEVSCRSCKAPVGQRCTSKFKGQAIERKPHYRRKVDARLVQDAARAMLHR